MGNLLGAWNGSGGYGGLMQMPEVEHNHNKLSTLMGEILRYPAQTNLNG